MGKETHNAAEVYENDGALTFSRDYIMPSKVLWNRLLVASQEGYIGETVLLSAAVLRETDLEKIYPELFRDVLVSLYNVGLTDISDSLAISAALGDSD